MMEMNTEKETIKMVQHLKKGSLDVQRFWRIWLLMRSEWLHGNPVIQVWILAGKVLWYKQLHSASYFSVKQENRKIKVF